MAANSLNRYNHTSYCRSYCTEMRQGNMLHAVLCEQLYNKRSTPEKQTVKTAYLEKFLRVPDEERYAIIQLLDVSLKITCHHLQHRYTKKKVRKHSKDSCNILGVKNGPNAVFPLNGTA